MYNYRKKALPILQINLYILILLCRISRNFAFFQKGYSKTKISDMIYKIKINEDVKQM